MLKFALAIAVSAEAASPGGLRLLAKDDSKTFVATPLVDSVMTREGVNAEAIQNQVAIAMRRCGFTIAPGGHSVVLVLVNGLSHEKRGYSAQVEILVRMRTTLGGEDVMIDIFTEGSSFAGAPGSAAPQLRTALAELLDRFCNGYLQARDEVRSEAKK